MEIYAVEIQMHNETRNHKKLKVLPPQSEHRRFSTLTDCV
jgi:hypothetical protein